MKHINKIIENNNRLDNLDKILEYRSSKELKAKYSEEEFQSKSKKINDLLNDEDLKQKFKDKLKPILVNLLFNDLNLSNENKNKLHLIFIDNHLTSKFINEMKSKQELEVSDFNEFIDENFINEDKDNISDEELKEYQQVKKISPDFNDGTAFYILLNDEDEYKKVCSIEKKFGDHCGNNYRDREKITNYIISLRDNNLDVPDIKGTFIVADGKHFSSDSKISGKNILIESKGNSNQKISVKKFHEQLKWLIDSDYVEGIHSDGHNMKNNFHISDLYPYYPDYTMDKLIKDKDKMYVDHVYDIVMSDYYQGEITKDEIKELYIDNEKYKDTEIDESILHVLNIELTEEEEMRKYDIDKNKIKYDEDGLIIYQGSIDISDQDLTKIPKFMKKIKVIQRGFYCYKNKLENFKGLENLKEIQGDFNCSFNKLESFKGLENLTEIQGCLDCSNNKLESFKGLENITEIKGYFDCTFNDLKNFEGLENLKEIKGKFNCFKNKLENFKGLENITEIKGYFDCTFNDLKNFEGLENLKEIKGKFKCYENKLDDFKGLENLKEIKGKFNCSFNKLESFKGLENLTEIQGGFNCFKNKLESFKGLENITEIKGYFDCTFNDLKNFEGLEKLNIIQGQFKCYENKLVDFKGLENLTEIQGCLDCSNNKLENFEGLENLKEIKKNIYCYDNPNLELTEEEIREKFDGIVKGEIKI